MRRSRSTIVALLGCLALASASAAQPTARSQAQSTSTQSPAEIVAQVARDYMARESVPGAGIGISVAGKASVHVFGSRDDAGSPVQADTLFSIGSVTKVLTAALLGLAVNAGEMSLDDPVAKYLPELAREGDSIRETTLEQLATFTAGLPDDPPPEFRADPAAVLRFLTLWRVSPEQPVGSYLYSNVSYGTIGYALQRAAGTALGPETYLEILRRRLLDPLGMTATRISIPPGGEGGAAVGHHGARTIDRPWRNAWYAAGSVGSTTSDMLRFLEAAMQTEETPPAISAAMRLAQEVRVHPSGKPFAQALAWIRREVDGVPVVLKEGGVTGFTACVAWSPGARVGVTLLSNQGESNGCRPTVAILTRLARSAPAG